MNLRAVGTTFRDAPVELRERLACSDADAGRALLELNARYDCEAVLLGTCNRVELYLGRPAGAAPLDAELVAEFWGEFRGVPAAEVRPLLVERRDGEAVGHLFRVAASLDSMIVGEGQIAGQVKRAYELATAVGAAGPLLNALFQHANAVAKRVRRETGIARGHVSVSSVAVDYVRQVFDHFGDKTVLVIGAGKMGALTLRHLKDLNPGRVLVTNRSPEKAMAVAAGCGGEAVAWDRLDDALAKADIVLSTTGAPEPVVTAARYRAATARRSAPQVILDIAVPRDFDPAIHDGERACLYDVDDLRRVCDETLADRRQHVPAAEAIVEAERQRFLRDWARRRNGPVIARLTREIDAKRQSVVAGLMARLNGRLTPEEREQVEGAFRLLQNQILHGPISALAEAPHEGGSALLEAVRQLFRLRDGPPEFP
jgi:glutamyl-tRNA reductase